MAPVMLEKRRTVFVVGIVSVLTLWTPPLPWTLRATDLPLALLDFLSFFKAVKPTEKWPVRWDYLVFPLVAIHVARHLWKSRVSAAECGLTLRNFGGALRYLALPTLGGAVLLLLMGMVFHTLEPSTFGSSSRFWKRLLPFNALLQQMGIQLFFHRQLLPWYGNGRRTAGMLALFFVALHFPNPGLMLGTLYGMYFWARCYQRFPNLYAIAISHAFLSALAMSLMPKWLLPSVSVGYRFYEKALVNHWWGWFQ